MVANAEDPEIAAFSMAVRMRYRNGHGRRYDARMVAS